MAWTYELILVVLLWILKITEGQNAQVTCVISKRCMLPCTIEPHGGDVVIHWYQAKNNDNPVHSYYLGKDQPFYQDSRYRGRTSLFTDLISPGNASLSLTDVKIEDQGRYKCYTSTTKGNDEQFVKVEVEDTQIQPETAETQSNAQGLFSITSSVKKTSNSTYICTVTAGQTTQTSSLKQQSLSAKEGEDLIIPCSVPGANANLKDFTLTWLFDGNAKVLTFDSRTSQSEAYCPWKGHVKYTDKETAITLHNLNDNTLSGRYSCEVVTTKFRHLEETEVFLQSERGPGGPHPAAIAVPVAVVVIIIVGLVGIVVKKKICDATATAFTSENDNTACELQTDKPSSETGNAESQKLTNGQ
ncbi:uncharacterized protein hhla2b.2 isoform X2 [Alosa alosa]|uniref:uncharacterized protein hhla2b.2 isoform X2 n=1 Tax=Alosa alosa TaxID=278164 RepID=UPI0020151E56|nr:uncharacterized protein hhla2b.2 isoform X2 [Alosa alosa]